MSDTPTLLSPVALSRSGSQQPREPFGFALLALSSVGYTAGFEMPRGTRRGTNQISNRPYFRGSEEIGATFNKEN